MRRLKTYLLAAICLLIISNTPLWAAQEKTGSKPSLPAPKNVIFFVSDGMGFNHLLATNYFEHGTAKAQIFEQDDWVSLPMATYPSILRIKDGDTLYAEGYNPQRHAKDPKYPISSYTDSGAGATSLSTGVKSYNGTIGIGIYGDTLTHVSEAAKAIGKSIGVVSSVPLSHATPAGFIAHNSRRNNYAEIARYMLFDSQADVIMGPGNPKFDENGNPAKNDYHFVGGEDIWEALTTNDGRLAFEQDGKTYHVRDANGNGEPDAWHLIQSRAEFLQMQDGDTPQRVLGVPKVHSTLQQSRDAIEGSVLPFETPYNESIPTLEEMTLAAINVLQQNPEGFFVMVEGGAVDWASHGHQSDRMIEEQIDFNNSVSAAVQWVETHSSWDETLIIVTSDHECGYLTGLGEPNPIYDFVSNKGKGNLPGMQWHYGSHTNVLVPFFAKGPGSELFTLMADEFDPIFGRFIQNSEVPQVLFLMWGKPERNDF